MYLIYGEFDTSFDEFIYLKCAKLRTKDSSSTKIAPSLAKKISPSFGETRGVILSWVQNSGNNSSKLKEAV